jgi:hypothetical protein
MPFQNCRIYQPPNAHVRISWILLRNAVAAVAVKKIITATGHCTCFFLDPLLLVD